MKPALTHLLAAAVGAVLVFLFLRPASNPGAGHEPKHRAQPEAPRPPSNRTANLLARIEGKKPAESEDNDFDTVFRKHGARKPTRAQLEDYIASRNGDPEAIMAAGLILRDTDLLRRALKKDPDNPQLLLAAIGQADPSDEEKLAWRRRFAESDPNNAMGSYLLAGHLLKSGDLASAMEHLRAAATRPDFQDFSLHNMLAVEEAYRGTGSSPLGAKLQSAFNLASPASSDLGHLAIALQERIASLDPEDGAEVRNITAGLGVRMTEDLPIDSLLSDVIGIGMQATSLSGLPADAPSPFEGLTVSEASACLEQRRTEIIAATRATPDPGVFGTLPPELIEGYLSRLQQLGEAEAIEWLNERIGSSPD